MATNDVPGSNPTNRDDLHVGCWAEHPDGSLLLVEGVENNRVVYVMFDMRQQPTVQYRSAMPTDGFMRQFSWNRHDPSSIRWIWHDRTEFPWERVVRAGIQDGPGFASADDLLTAAARVAQSLGLVPQSFQPANYDHLIAHVGPTGAQRIIDNIQQAIGRMPT